MKVYSVLVRYRTKSGCNAKTWAVKAPDMQTAINFAIALQRRRRGVVKIDAAETSDGAIGVSAPVFETGVPV